MFNLKSKPIAIVLAGLSVLGLSAYSLYSIGSHLEAVEHDLQAAHKQDATRLDELTAEFNEVTQNLDKARSLAVGLNTEHTQMTQKLSAQLKSTSAAVNQLKQESASKIDAVQQDATTRIGAVSGEVQTVKSDLGATQENLASSRKEIADIAGQIARNSTELAELRRLGEHNYFEFDVRKAKEMERIADVRLQLKKTDTKKNRYDVMLLVDDNKLEKKDQTTNEPVTFLVGRDQLRYELVVNYVDKDRIRGYLSTPKNVVISAEGPALRK